jgi:hypothetical protein
MITQLDDGYHRPSLCVVVLYKFCDSTFLRSDWIKATNYPVVYDAKLGQQSTLVHNTVLFVFVISSSVLVFLRHRDGPHSQTHSS